MPTIHMPLLNEGTDVWRPVNATQLSAATYRIEGEMPDDEEWAFPPGTIVRGVHKTSGDGRVRITAVRMP